MKPNILMKFAVVAMAAFGAYAFNTSSESSDLSFLNDMNQCRNITAECSQSGLEDCVINVEGNEKIVLGFKCTNEIKHFSGQPVNWSYLPNN